MNIVLWILQILLALIFIMTGSMKLIQKKEAVLERMGEQMGWVNDFTQQQLYLIGLLEIASALGLILPALTGIFPILVPLAAVGLAFVMAGAAITHLRRRERSMMVITIVIMLAALFVANGRFNVVPF